MERSTPHSEWLKNSEACLMLKVSRRTLYTYIESGYLPHYQLRGSGHRRIRAEDLEALLAPVVLQEQLGHKDINITRIFLRLCDEDIKREVQKLQF